jgi:hypothetical protein
MITSLDVSANDIGIAVLVPGSAKDREMDEYYPYMNEDGVQFDDDGSVKPTTSEDISTVTEICTILSTKS